MEFKEIKEKQIQETVNMLHVQGSKILEQIDTLKAIVCMYQLEVEIQKGVYQLIDYLTYRLGKYTIETLKEKKTGCSEEK